MMFDSQGAPHFDYLIHTDTIPVFWPAAVALIFPAIYFKFL